MKLTNTQMEPKDVDPTMEIISLLRKRDALCDEWFKKVISRIKSGELPYEEGMEQIRKINAEMDKTRDAIIRLEDYLKNVRITGNSCPTMFPSLKRSPKLPPHNHLLPQITLKTSSTHISRPQTG